MKIAKINLERYRLIHGKQFKKDEYFKPTYDKDGNIFISEIEVNGMSEDEYPWKRELVLKEPQEILTSTDKEWYEKYKAELEVELQNATLKVEENQDPIQEEIKK